MADENPQGQHGIGVDAYGRSVIDPTENVVALVKAGEITAEKLREADKRFLDAQLRAQQTLQDYARESEIRLQNFAREAEAKLQTAMREAEARYARDVAAAETRRIDQLAETRQEFQNTIRDMLAESVRTTSSLVSTQLVQIQATFDARVTKLEQAQLTQAGRSSVADPAIEAMIARNAARLSSIESDLMGIRSNESTAGGRMRGSMDTNARLLAVVMAVAAIASPIVAVVLTIMAMRGH
jgi:hypothetical protein